MKYIKSVSIISIIIVIAAIFVSCEKKDNSVIDPVYTFPKILGTAIKPSTFDTSAISAIAWAKVTSEEPVQKVTVTVKNPDNLQLAVFELKDNGVSPDTNAGDGKYVGRISFTLPCYLIGTYKGEFLATNESGLNSSLISSNFGVTNSHNRPPSLSNLVAVDSLQIPSGIGNDTIRYSSFQITATDPEGPCDLTSNAVFFNSFKPGGQPSSGNPFTMYDDGNTQGHCDNVANDGIYSSCFVIVNNPNGPFPPPQPGAYTFKFNARDRSFALSDTLVHIIHVYQ